MPASSFGRLVVHLLTWQKAWKVQRWMRVAGHIALAAFANPGAPSVTAMAGAGILIMRAAHALAHSDRARCHASTCSLVQAMSATASRPIQMPSKKTASQTSPVNGAIGHMRQNSLVILLNVAREHPMSACVAFEKSHLRNMSRRLARESILRTEEQPQALQRHLCLPEDVVPFLRIGRSQISHFGLFTIRSRLEATSLLVKLA